MEILEQQLWAVFGGRSEYLAAPWELAQRHRLVIAARNTVQREVNDHLSSGDVEVG